MMPFLGDLERMFAEAIYPNRVLVGFIVAGMLVLVAVVARRRHWSQNVRRHRRASLLVFVVGLAIVVPLGWYLGSPLFTSTTIDEPPPVAAAASVEPAPVPRASSSTGSPSPSAKSAATPSPSAAPVVERSGTFAGADDFHFGQGTARLIETAPGTFTVRLEDFAVRNGPDLFVYLSTSGEGYADGAIELGRLKADRGNQNYEVPAGSDLSEVASVVIWCKQFAVLFATAALADEPA
jgi:Electron transfer DM13